MTDAERVLLSECCSLVVDGALDSLGRGKLEDLLRTSEEARQFYVRAMQLSASLHSYAAEMQSEPATLEAQAVDADIFPPEDLIFPPERELKTVSVVEPENVIRPARWRNWWGPMAAAAIVLLGLWIGRLFVPPAKTTEDGPELVARVTGGKDCQWAGFAPATGDELAAGQQLELRAGVAELTFDSGAQLTVEGPATMQILSAWDTELRRGTVTAKVPEEAIGFRVINAAVEIVDLGTEFSVTANEDGGAEVLVLKGEVEVHPRDQAGKLQAKSVLRERQARRFGRMAGSGEVRDREEKFQKAMRKVALVRLARPLNFARWSFDENAGLVAKVDAPANESRDLATNANARWTAGRFGAALEFDGDTTANADLAPPLRRGVRTIAFWTRVPGDAPLSEARVFASVPSNRAWGSRIDLGWNRQPAEGTFGAVRFHSGAGDWVGSSALRDGRWHHVAVVLGLPPKAPGAARRPPLKLYVDGRLERFSEWRPGGLGQKAAGDGDGKLWLGGTPDSSERFRGTIDELVVTDLPLTPQEIRHLMRTNTLLAPEAIAEL